MLTILSGLLGFASSGLPKVLEFFQDKADKKHELAILEKQTERELELRKAGLELEKDIAEIKIESSVVDAQIRESEALYSFSTKVSEGASRWIINLRASVQPVITYGLFFILLGVDAFAAWYAYYTSVDFTTTVATIWDQDTQAMWALIVSFWFGGRQFGNSK